MSVEQTQNERVLSAVAELTASVMNNLFIEKEELGLSTTLGDEQITNEVAQSKVVSCVINN